MRSNRKSLIMISVLSFCVLVFSISLASAAGAAPGTAQPKMVFLQIGNSTAKVGDEYKTLDSAPVIVNGRTMVPVRFITEALGLQVRWDPTTRTVVFGPQGADLTAVPLPVGVTGVGTDKYVSNPDAFAGKTAANWNEMTTVRVDLTEMAFTPKNLTFEAGKPYKLEVRNSGEVKHEFTAGSFFRSIALRKVEDGQAEIKLPFLSEVEVFAGQQADLYFVPLIPGTYEMLCEIAGHREAGMEGTITVTGTPVTVPEIQVGNVADASGVPNSAALVQQANWTEMETVGYELGEMFFKPDPLRLKVGKPYKIQLKNVGEVKHELDAEAFFRTTAIRKVQDAAVELKGPSFNEIEVFAGQQTDVYLIPTKAGTYEVACRIPGHYEAGMKATVVVEE